MYSIEVRSQIGQGRGISSPPHRPARGLRSRERRIDWLRSGGFTRYETSLPKLPASPLQPATEAVRVLWSIHSRGASIHARRDCGTRPPDGRVVGEP